MSGLSQLGGLSWLNQGLTAVGDGLTLPGGLTFIDDAIYTLNLMNGTLPDEVTFTRTSNAWYFDTNGLLAIASTNVARFDYGTPGSTTLKGLLIEAQQTNVIVQSRDLTQAAWVKVNITAALDQVGIDGISNSASSATATLANATVLQTNVNLGTNRTFSVYLKRITGTGTINITQDGGVTYTAVVPTSSWQRFVHANQTTTNATFGIQIVTSGDAIAVDCTQFEQGNLATSPIVTTGTSLTRSIDVAKITSIPWFNAVNGSFVTEANSYSNAGSEGTADFNDGTTNNRISAVIASGNLAKGNITIAGAASQSGGSLGGVTINTIFKQGIAYISGGNISTFNGSVDTAGTFGAAALPTGLNQLRIGDAITGVATIRGWMRQFRYWNYPLTNAQLQRETT